MTDETTTEKLFAFILLDDTYLMKCYARGATVRDAFLSFADIWHRIEGGELDCKLDDIPSTIKELERWHEWNLNSHLAIVEAVRESDHDR